MEQKVSRKFIALEADVVCECKKIIDPIDDSTDLHNHEGYEILLVLEGSINLYTEYGGITMEQGNLVCIPPFVFHRGELLTNQRYDRIVLNITEFALERISSLQTDLRACFGRFPSTKLNVVHLSEKELVKMVICAKALQKSLRGKDAGDELLTDAYLKIVMVSINRFFYNQKILPNTEIMPELIIKTFNYIEKHISEQITLKKLEDHINHNGTYISRCFKKTTGIPLKQYIIEKKMALSCKLLQEGHAPCDVCYMAGFNNYSNYSRTFSNQIGMSPKKYQVNNRYI